VQLDESFKSFLCRLNYLKEDDLPLLLVRTALKAIKRCVSIPFHLLKRQPVQWSKNPNYILEQRITKYTVLGTFVIVNPHIFIFPDPDPEWQNILGNRIPSTDQLEAFLRGDVKFTSSYCIKCTQEDRTVRKICQLDEHVLMAFAGLTADARFVFSSLIFK